MRRSWLSNASLALAIVVISPSLPALAGERGWTPTETMVDGHSLHAVAVLRDGRALVCGGLDARGMPSANAELYDPETAEWSATGPMNLGRARHTATVLPSGEVLVVGGLVSNSAESATAELYDPDTGAWTLTDSMAVTRDLHTATAMPDGSVLVVSGEAGGTSGSAELYDPATGAWTSAGSMAFVRKAHTATLLADGRVLVVGGMDPDGAIPARAEIYDPAARRWETVDGTAVGRFAHTATLLQDGTVLVAGGLPFTLNRPPFIVPYVAAAEVFDPLTNRWTRVGNLGTARGVHIASLLPNGKVLVAGGASSPDLSRVMARLGSAELYDPATEQWTYTGCLHVERASHRATTLLDGTILVTGGIAFGASLPSAEIYDPATTEQSTPPTVTRIKPLGRGGASFRVKILGKDFRPGAQVFVGDDVAPWPTTAQKGETQLVLKGGRALEERFPRATLVPVRVVNPDGCSVATAGLPF